MDIFYSEEDGQYAAGRHPNYARLLHRTDLECSQAQRLRDTVSHRIQPEKPTEQPTEQPTETF